MRFRKIPKLTEYQAARFWAKVNKTSTCWLYTGRINSNGYGSFKIRGHPYKVHRVAWTLLKGPIPKGKNVLHRCDIRNCVRHLWVGTQWENLNDASKKGRLLGRDNGDLWKLH